MKLKHFFWIAVFVSRFLKEEDEENYLECADEEFEE